MSKRDASEVEAEWRGLIAIKHLVPHYSPYRVSNWSMIDVQVRTLRDGLSLRQIRATWPVLDDGDRSSAAESAR